MKEKIDNILRAALEFKASDIHLTVGVPPVFRINGDIKRYGKDILLPADTEEMAKLTIPENMYDLFKEKGELDYSYGIPGVSRFRVNAYHQRKSVSLALRVVASKTPTIEDLDLPEIVPELVEKPQGLNSCYRSNRKW